MTELRIFMLNNKKSSCINNFINDEYLDCSSKELCKNAEEINKYNLAVFPLNEQLKGNHNVSGKIFILQEKREKVNWSESVNAFSEKKLDLTTSNILNKPLIIIKISKNSIFAISYSYGYTLLNREYVVHDFGLDIARKKLDLDTIKRVKNTNLAETLYVSSFSSNNKINLNEVSNSQSIPNIVDEILGEMTVKFCDEDKNIKELNIFASSKDSIKINGNFSIKKDLVPILKELGKIYREKKSERTFLNKEILTVFPKKEKSLDERFNKYLSNLMDIYKKNSNEFKLSNLDKLSIDIPLSKVDNDVEDLQFRIHSICKPNEYLNFFDYTQEEIFSKIFSYFLKNNIQEFVKQIKSIQVSIKNPNLDSSMKIGSLFSCLYMEFNQNADKYILYQGNWFSLNKNIWYETKDFVNSIPSETYGIDFKEFNNTDNDEGDYNLKISSLESNKGLICLDKKNFTSKNVGGGFTFYGINPQSKIEPCDILKVSNDNAIFCHIKRGTKSSGLSHLLSQARTSCNLIRSSEEFVNYINSVIQKESSDVHTVCLNDANLKFSKVILGCIVPASKVQTKNSNLFPILFCLNLVALVNALFLDKFEVSLVKIPDKKTS